MKYVYNLFRSYVTSVGYNRKISNKYDMRKKSRKTFSTEKKINLKTECLDLLMIWLFAVVSSWWIWEVYIFFHSHFSVFISNSHTLVWCLCVQFFIRFVIYLFKLHWFFAYFWIVNWIHSLVLYIIYYKNIFARPVRQETKHFSSFIFYVCLYIFD